jgi:hypothetical protein
MDYVVKNKHCRKYVVNKNTNHPGMAQTLPIHFQLNILGPTQYVLSEHGGSMQSAVFRILNKRMDIGYYQKM